MKQPALEEIMTLNQVDKAFIQDSDPSTIFTPTTLFDYATVNTSKQNVPELPSSSSIPWPGSTYIIRSVSTGKVVTFRRGKIIMAPLNGHNAIRWECVEKDGWLGFRDPASYMYLGYDEDGNLRCSMSHHCGWESFCVRRRPDGDYLLLMFHYESLKKIKWKGFRPVGLEMKDGVEKMTVLEDWKSDTTAWRFIEVESSKD